MSKGTPSSVKRVVSMGDGDHQLSIGHAVRARERSAGMHLREIFGNTASATDFAAVAEEGSAQSQQQEQRHRRNSSVGCSSSDPPSRSRTTGFFSGRLPPAEDGNGGGDPHDPSGNSSLNKTAKRKTQLGELLATSIAGNDVTGSCLYSIGPVVGVGLRLFLSSVISCSSLSPSYFSSSTPLPLRLRSPVSGLPSPSSWSPLCSTSFAASTRRSSARSRQTVEATMGSSTRPGSLT